MRRLLVVLLLVLQASCGGECPDGSAPQVVSPVYVRCPDQPASAAARGGASSPPRRMLASAHGDGGER
ncbi:MAG: hypothetical protein KJ023_00165 [Burkholderiaceae bacterium]|nr:hypothetical protein [Burkholderiaceae bacterium]